MAALWRRVFVRLGLCVVFMWHVVFCIGYSCSLSGLVHVYFKLPLWRRRRHEFCGSMASPSSDGGAEYAHALAENGIAIWQRGVYHIIAGRWPPRL